MGAEEFYTTGTGATAHEAFNEAKERAYYDVGHQGYSGTIAEKEYFSEIPCDMNPKAIKETIEKCLNDMDHFCQDKWGDAGAIRVSENKWVFFGWASS